MIPVLEVVEALNREGVVYVVVGGLAVALHGVPRMTQDIDIVLSLQPDNVASALKVLGKLGMRPVPPVDLASFADASMRKKWQDEKSMIVLSLMHPSKPLLSVDLFVESPIPFDELLASAVAMAFAGSSIRVASIDHLIRMKKASGRSMDLSDVTALEELRNE